MEKKMEKAIIDIIIVIAGATGCFFYLYGRFYERLAWRLRSETPRETSNYLLIFIIFLLTVHLVRTWRKISSRIKDFKKPEKMKGDEQIEQHENLSSEEIRAIHNVKSPYSATLWSTSGQVWQNLMVFLVKERERE